MDHETTKQMLAAENRRLAVEKEKLAVMNKELRYNVLVKAFETADRGSALKGDPSDAKLVTDIASEYMRWINVSDDDKKSVIQTP